MIFDFWKSIFQNVIAKLSLVPTCSHASTVSSTNDLTTTTLGGITVGLTTTDGGGTTGTSLDGSTTLDGITTLDGSSTGPTIDTEVSTPPTKYPSWWFWTIVDCSDYSYTGTDPNTGNVIDTQNIFFGRLMLE